jgi:hypothetical protein
MTSIVGLWWAGEMFTQLPTNHQYSTQSFRIARRQGRYGSACRSQTDAPRALLNDFSVEDPH